MTERQAAASTGFFGVIAQPRSYLNMLYLLLGLPLGTLYFTVLVTGIALGLGLMVVALIGIPILVGLWYVVHAFIQLEREVAVGLVGVEIGTVDPLPAWPGGLWRHFKHFLGHAPTWKRIAYLLLRFPVGVATFTIAVTLVATSLALTFAPVYTWIDDEQTWGSWTFDPFWWSFLLVPVGFVMVFVSLHAMNALAGVCARWTRWSIDGRASVGWPAPTAPPRGLAV